MDYWENNPLASQVAGLYGCSVQPVAVVDAALSVVWANERAQDMYPFLKMPDGVLTMLRLEDAKRVCSCVGSGQPCSALAGAQPLPMARLYFSPLPCPEGSPYSLALFEVSGGSGEDLPDAFTALASYTNQIRAPLSRIFLSLNMLSRHAWKQTGMGPDPLKDISQNSYRLLRHCVNLTEYSRYISASNPLECRRINLTQSIRELCSGVRDVLISSGMELEFSTPGRDVACLCDWPKLEVALLNLISNACHYQTVNSTITLTLETRRQSAVVTVVDRGMGIPEEMLPLVFHPFFTHDESASESAGGGLGLTVAKLCVEAHGGSIAVSSIREVGTTVAVTLPTCDDGSLTLSAPDTSSIVCDRFSSLFVVLSDVCDCPWP